MRELQGRTEERRQDAAAAELTDKVVGLFARWPALDGFSIQDPATLSKDRVGASLDGALCIADVVVRTWPGYGPGKGLCEDIADAMLELLEERPEASELLRGITFARALH